MKNNIGMNYPIWVKKPKKIDITKKDFFNLSYFGLASLWCSFKVLFCYTDLGDLEMYLHDEALLNVFMKNHRFKDIKWFEISSAEMFGCTIPKDYKVFNSIEQYFNYLIML